MRTGFYYLIDLSACLLCTLEERHSYFKPAEGPIRRALPRVAWKKRPCAGLQLFVFNIRGFTAYESCTRPIPTNPGSTEATELGLARGVCFAAHRLEVVAVSGLLWFGW